LGKRQKFASFASVALSLCLKLACREWANQLMVRDPIELPMRPIWKVVVVAVAVLLQVPYSTLQADDKEQPNKSLDRQRIEALIADLRSPNKDPNPKFQPFIKLPKAYDLAAQEKVERAREELIEMKEAAFPVLIDHLKDKPYSSSISTAIFRSLSVGEVCFMIIEGQVDLAGMRYKARTGSDGKGHTHTGYFSQYCKDGSDSRDGLARWWKEHENKSLKEMQIEALEWSIERERAIGFPNEKDREHYLNPLVKMLADLKRPVGQSNAMRERNKSEVKRQGKSNANLPFLPPPREE
jgi:hypothetical protein